MEGAARAAERQLDRDLSMAWHTAAFSGAAQAGKLKKLEEYQRKQASTQTPDQMLGQLFALKDLGAPMSIEKMN